MTALRGGEVKDGFPLKLGTIVVVHNLRNRLFLPQFGLQAVPLMVSVVDIAKRPYLRRAIERFGIKLRIPTQSGH
jgi:hypothetical protein